MEGLFKEGCFSRRGPPLQEEIPLSVEAERDVLFPYFDPNGLGVLKVSPVQSVGDSEDRG